MFSYLVFASKRYEDYLVMPAEVIYIPKSEKVFDLQFVRRYAKLAPFNHGFERESTQEKPLFLCGMAKCKQRNRSFGNILVNAQIKFVAQRESL